MALKTPFPLLHVPTATQESEFIYPIVRLYRVLAFLATVLRLIVGKVAVGTSEYSTMVIGEGARIALSMPFSGTFGTPG